VSKEIISGDWKELSIYLQNNNFCHYSFDFWNTIAFSNPKFKDERTNLICNYFENKFNKQLIKEAFSKIGNAFNEQIEYGGITKTTNELYNEVFEFIGVNQTFDLENVKKQIFDLFLKYPPTLSEDFILFLESTKTEKITLSITSNTAFIPGSIIQECLKKLNIFDRFDFYIFSDIEQCSKPNFAVFEKILNKSEFASYTNKDIIHIGDNLKTDYLGAKSANISPFLLLNEKPISNARHALHIINDIENIPFSDVEYSKFKFGDYSIAEKYGSELYDYFETNLSKELFANFRSVIIYSSPYAKIPTSSFYLTQTFYNLLLKNLKNNNQTGIDVKFGKIKRCQTYIDDYGAMNADERFELIKNDTYEFITIPKKEDVCIFIDDISITGTHQKVIEQLLCKNAFETNSFFLYYAKLSNPEVCPSFENRLNYAYINDMYKLTQLLTSNSYKITTRTVKYILSQEKKKFNELIDRMLETENISLLKEMASMSHANEYNDIELYKPNLNQLELSLSEFN
jgi:FMN phosphatase YigB (HAD superfamily)